jgi:hypothetical protein
MPWLRMGKSRVSKSRDGKDAFLPELKSVYLEENLGKRLEPKTPKFFGPQKQFDTT